MNLLLTLSDSALTDGPGALGLRRWKPPDRGVRSSYPGGSDGWLAAVGPTTSSLSTTIRPICLQFPHSSSVPSEVHCDRFPTPPQLSTTPHCTYNAASLGLHRPEHIHRTNYPVHPHSHSHTGIHAHNHTNTSSNRFHCRAKAGGHPWGRRWKEDCGERGED